MSVEPFALFHVEPVMPSPAPVFRVRRGLFGAAVLQRRLDAGRWRDAQISTDEEFCLVTPERLDYLEKRLVQAEKRRIASLCDRLPKAPVE